ncbi:dihydroneopterin aldolase [Novispirillum itersonii]|uniref:dihydroneopterin aldolase n=1 Tax=Novispirillum itersonii TaxID=189 RepID=UPI00035ED1AA|nr:dihydroneopterin aldolase [Novispirillum itersonii]
MSSSPSASAPVIAPFRPTSPRIADAAQGLRHVFVRDMVVTCLIGVYDYEHTTPQRVRINVDLGVLERLSANGDSLDQVVCYEQIANRVRAMAQDGHVNLVETLSERIAAICLQDPRVRMARVRVEKLDVISDVAAVGVEIERISTLPQP